MANNEYKTLISNAREHGWQVITVKGSHVWTSPDGKNQFHSSAFSDDPRAVKNAQTSLKRYGYKGGAN